MILLWINLEWIRKNFKTFLKMMSIIRINYQVVHLMKHRLWELLFSLQEVIIIKWNNHFTNKFKFKISKAKKSLRIKKEMI